MRKINNTSPGSMAACLVRQYLEANGKRQAFLAEALGVCDATLSKWILGVSRIPFARKQQIAELTGVAPNTWLEPPFKFKGNEKTYHRDRARDRREAILIVMGPCSACGGESNLELHHIDPSQKVSHRIWSWAPARMRAELRKCHVLCSACHEEAHKNLRQQMGAGKGR